jgi:Tfp pilus assembly protein PilV
MKKMSTLKNNLKISQLKTSLGASIIEATITMGLLSVGLVALAKVQTLQLSSMSELRQSSEAEKIAKSQMEKLRTYSVISETAGHTAYNNIVTGTETITGKNAAYAASWTV